MTLSALIKKLQELESAGYGRAKVSVDKSSLWDGNGTFQICDIKDAVFDRVRLCDGDGFGVENRDGSERTTRNIVLSGGWD